MNQFRAERNYEYRPAVLAVDLPSERVARQQFETRFLGRIGLADTVETTAEVVAEKEWTLAECLELAGDGDVEAEALVDANVIRTVSESVFKDNHRTRVVSKKSQSGEVSQHRLTAQQMHLNAYIYRPKRGPILKQYILAEALNSYRQEALISTGQLEDNWLIVPSCVADEAELGETDLDGRGEGYFTRSMTYNLQGTTVEGSDVITETVFRRGTAANDDANFAQRQLQRYDLEAIGLVYEWLGLPAPKTALEFLQNPILVRKDLLPNGIVDFLRWCDVATDRIQKHPQDRPEQYYQQMIIDSERRDASLSATNLLVKQALLSRAGSFSDPLEAITALWDITKKYTVQAAANNHHIDPMVFGRRAAVRLERARFYAAIGNIDMMDRWLVAAERFAEVSGCGGGSKSRTGESAGSAEGVEPAEQADSAWHGGKVHKNEKCQCCKRIRSEVGACYICKDCVANPAKMEAAYRLEKDGAATPSLASLALKVFGHGKPLQNMATAELAKT